MKDEGHSTTLEKVFDRMFEMPKLDARRGKTSTMGDQQQCGSTD